MRRLSLLAILLLASASARGADKPPIYLWLEPEWFDGVKGSFGYWTGEAKPTGSWGVAGPGISPEWTQGGESEWNSMGVPASETKASCGRDLVIPRAGKYRVWVRYVDHRKKTEPFTLKITPAGKAAVSAELGPQVRRGVQEDPPLAVRAHGHGRLGTATVVVPGIGAVGAPAVPLRQSAARRRPEDDHAHGRKLKRPGSSPGPSVSCANLVQALPAYAPTSIPSSTTSNSGLVHDISHPPETGVVDHSNRVRAVQAPCHPWCGSRSPPQPHPLQAIGMHDRCARGRGCGAEGWVTSPNLGVITQSGLQTELLQTISQRVA